MTSEPIRAISFAGFDPEKFRSAPMTTVAFLPSPGQTRTEQIGCLSIALNTEKRPRVRRTIKNEINRLCQEAIAETRAAWDGHD